MRIIKRCCMIEAGLQEETAGGALALAKTMDLNQALFAKYMDVESLCNPNLQPVLEEVAVAQQKEVRSFSGCFDAWYCGSFSMCCGGQSGNDTEEDIGVCRRS